MTFRPATANDIPLLRDLAAGIWRRYYPGIISLEQIEYMLGWMYSPEKIAAELDGGVHWEVALLDGAAVGFFSLSCPPAAAGELHKLYLLPELHGRGLGQAMLERAVTCAAARGCTELRLRVNKGNARALRSYQRAGFGIIDSLVDHIGHGFVMDDYVLSRRITES